MNQFYINEASAQAGASFIYKGAINMKSKKSSWIALSVILAIIILVAVVVINQQSEKSNGTPETPINEQNLPEGENEVSFDDFN